MANEFDELVSSARSELERKVVVKPRAAEFTYDCPCCGYRLLPDRGCYSICALCAWEDDGQDDPFADQTWAGPNGEFSLTQARGNFKRYLVMYPPDEDYRAGGPDSAGETELKRRLLAVLERKLSSSELVELVEALRSARRSSPD